MNYYKFCSGVGLRSIDGTEYLVNEKEHNGIPLDKDTRLIVEDLLCIDDISMINDHLSEIGSECDQEFVSSFIAHLLENGFLQEEPIPLLRKLTVYLTNACNLNCKYCMFRSGEKKVGELQTAEVINLIDQALALGLEEVVLSGGEATLHPGFMEIVNYIANVGRKLTIGTNGMTLSAGVIENLANKAVLLDLSLDSITKEINDELRGAGNYDQIRRVIEWCKQSQLPFNINSTIMRANYHLHKELGNFALSLGAEKYTASNIKMLGRALDYRAELELSDAEVAQVILFNDLWTEKNCPHKNRAETILLEKRDRGEGFDCGLGSAGIIISPTGNVLPCGTFPMDQPYCGNIRKNSLQDLWSGSKIHHLRKMSVCWIEKCRDCELKYVCGGGCRAFSYMEFGDVDARPDEVNCNIKLKIFSEIGHLYEQYGSDSQSWFEYLIRTD